MSKNNTGNANPNSGNQELVAGDIDGTKPDTINTNPRTTVAGKAMMLSSFMSVGFACLKQRLLLLGAEVVGAHLRYFVEDGIDFSFGRTAMLVGFFRI